MDVKKKLIPVQVTPEKIPPSKTPIVSELEKEYGKLAIVFFAITTLSMILFFFLEGEGQFKKITPFQSFIACFMGVFFITFSLFKLVNIKSFVHGFSMYDLIAKRSRKYGYAYPFMQLIIGIAMFALPDFWIVQLAALLLSIMAIIGVINSLINRQKIHCACLGNVIKMPLTTISAIEDGLMLVLSLYMFIAMV